MPPQNICLEASWRNVAALIQRPSAITKRLHYCPKPDRSAGGHRVYREEDLQRLTFIRRCREMGFSLEEIRGLLSLVDGEQVSCKRVKNIADEHLMDVRAKISDLKKIERTLSKLSASCSGKEVPQCPIIEALQIN